MTNVDNSIVVFRGNKYRIVYDEDADNACVLCAFRDESYKMCDKFNDAMKSKHLPDCINEDYHLEKYKPTNPYEIILDE